MPKYTNEEYMEDMNSPIVFKKKGKTKTKTMKLVIKPSQIRAFIIGVLVKKAGTITPEKSQESIKTADEIMEFLEKYNLLNTNIK